MTKTYSKKDLADILREMADYVEEDEVSKDYWEEIVYGGLFHDAVGKIIEDYGSEVLVTTEY